MITCNPTLHTEWHNSLPWFKEPMHSMVTLWYKTHSEQKRQLLALYCWWHEWPSGHSFRLFMYAWSAWFRISLLLFRYIYFFYLLLFSFRRYFYLPMQKRPSSFGPMHFGSGGRSQICPNVSRVPQTPLGRTYIHWPCLFLVGCQTPLPRTSRTHKSVGPHTAGGGVGGLCFCQWGVLDRHLADLSTPQSFPAWSGSGPAVRRLCSTLGGFPYRGTPFLAATLSDKNDLPQRSPLLISTTNAS